MKHTTHRRHHTAVLVAALVSILAVPTTMTGLFQSIDDDGYNAVPVEDMRVQALQDASRVRQLRRDFWRAVEVYKELVRMGNENLVPPTVNDEELIRYYLDPANFADADAQAHAAAEEETDVVATISDAKVQYNALLPRYQYLLDGYISAGYCPRSLAQYHLTGFYDLCTSLLDEHIAVTDTGILERGAFLRGYQSVGYAPLRSLRNRLENLQESLMYQDGTSIHPRSVQGNTRPRPRTNAASSSASSQE